MASRLGHLGHAWGKRPFWCAVMRSFGRPHSAWEGGEQQRTRVRRLLSACMLHAGLGLICLGLLEALPSGFISLPTAFLRQQNCAELLIEALGCPAGLLQGRTKSCRRDSSTKIFFTCQSPGQLSIPKTATLQRRVSFA